MISHEALNEQILNNRIAFPPPAFRYPETSQKSVGDFQKLLYISPAAISPSPCVLRLRR
jgi:hypothetical protein